MNTHIHQGRRGNCCTKRLQCNEIAEYTNITFGTKDSLCADYVNTLLGWKNEKKLKPTLQRTDIKNSSKNDESEDGEYLQ